VFDNLRVASFRPNLELLYRGSPERVGSREQDGVSLVPESARQFSDSGCFADAVRLWSVSQKVFLQRQRDLTSAGPSLLGNPDCAGSETAGPIFLGCSTISRRYCPIRKSAFLEFFECFRINNAVFEY
jgi:hypothetical protein